MKVAIPIINKDSGSYIFEKRLSSGLARAGVKVVNPHIPSFKIYVPCLFPLHLPYQRILHTNAQYAGYFRKKARVLVGTLHSISTEPDFLRSLDWKRRIYHRWWVERGQVKSFKVCDRVVAVSYYLKAVAEEILGFQGAVVIHNGVDENIFRPIRDQKRDDHRVRLLFVGNLTPGKGAHLLPRIMRALGSRYLLYYTSGLRGGSLPPAPNMLPLGTLKGDHALAAAYQKCDLLVLPTRREGFGLAVCEAMACAKPVVASDCSSLPELIDDGKGGYLCQKEDLEDFVEKIRHLGANPELREKMGHYNRQKVLARFTLSRMIERYLELYRSLDS